MQAYEIRTRTRRSRLSQPISRGNTLGIGRHASFSQSIPDPMALKATIFKADLQIADMDRRYYGDHTLTIARHP
jgi:YaeQ protein